MEVYDQNVLDWGIKSDIRSVKDAENIHDRMVKLDIKTGLGGPYDMPHYRGEQKFDWDILPNIFRLSSVKEDKLKAKNLEKKGWQEFENIVIKNFGNDALRTIFENEKYGKDWNLLMQAQHAGLKTSLLDWSPNIYAPLYFATEESKVPEIENSDGQFWVFMVPFSCIKSHNEFPIKSTYYDQDPQAVEDMCMINVSIFLDDLSERKYETRMFRQKGRFFISGINHWGVAMNKQPDIAPLLFRFIVPAECKSDIREDLKLRGIDYDYLYGPMNPDHQAIIDDIIKEVFTC